MGIFEQLRQQNLTHDLAGKNVLITGGTHGIGAAVAYHFAELGANVTIAGRNAKEAETILERLRSVAPRKDAEFEFVQMDASLNSNTVAFADKMCEKYKTGLYCLCMCQGGIANGSPRKETSEGHEWLLAVGVLSRYIIAAKLINVLRLSGGTILSIKAAGKFDKFDDDDIELRKLQTISFSASASREGAIHDVFAQEITSRTGVTYYHIFPGLVKTNFVETYEVGFPLSWVLRAATMVFGQTPDSYASAPVWVALTRPSYNTIGAAGKEAPINPYPKREEVRKKVMTWMENATGVKMVESG